MSLPKLKDYIYRSFSPELGGNGAMLEAMMNVMQATFVVLQSVSTLDEKILKMGHKIFHTLFTQSFKEKTQVNFSLFCNKVSVLSM